MMENQPTDILNCHRGNCPIFGVRAGNEKPGSEQINCPYFRLRQWGKTTFRGCSAPPKVQLTQDKQFMPILFRADPEGMQESANRLIPMGSRLSAPVLRTYVQAMDSYLKENQ